VKAEPEEVSRSMVGYSVNHTALILFLLSHYELIFRLCQ